MAMPEGKRVSAVIEGPPDRRRYWRIIRFFGGLTLHLIVWDLLFGRLFRRWVRRSRPERFRRWSRRFRGLAVQMGGVMIKLGQFLSARVDVLPPEVTDELKGLQDEVPPVPADEIRLVLEAELGDVAAHFARIELEPLAAASLGQAHRAWLWAAPTDETAAVAADGEGQTEQAAAERSAVVAEGSAVVVKVQRPRIEQIVQTDLAALRVVARWAMRYPPLSRRADVPALMEEFARTLWEELDYEAEAGNAERFATMFAGDEGVYIPAVYRDHSTRRVLVLENVEGIKITDVAAMRAAEIDPGEVAERLLDVYFRQIFQEGFFHADPHPGNLFVRLRHDGSEPGAGARPFALVFVDFGMVGRIQEAISRNLRRVLTSVTQRDARELTLAYQDMGFFLPGSDLDRITEAQAALLEQMWGRKLLDLSRPDPREVQALGKEFRDILFDFPFQVPQDFVYLGRAMGMLSGLVSLLDPEINPWYQIERYGLEIIRAQGGSTGRDFSRETIQELLRPFLSLPSQLQRVLSQAENGQLQLQLRPDKRTARRLDQLDNRVNRLHWSVLSAAGIIAGTMFYLEGTTAVAYGVWSAAAVVAVVTGRRRRE